MADVRKVDSRGRIVLGQELAGKEFLLDITSDGGFRVIPLEVARQLLRDE